MDLFSLVEVSGPDNDLGRDKKRTKEAGVVNDGSAVEGKVHSLALKKIPNRKRPFLGVANPRLIAKLFPQFFPLKNRSLVRSDKRKILAVWGVKNKLLQNGQVMIGIAGNEHNNWKRVDAVCDFCAFLKAFFLPLAKGIRCFSKFY